MKSRTFKLGNGDIVDLVEFGEHAIIRDPDAGCTITSNSRFGYIQMCYSTLMNVYDIGKRRPCVVHLGTGFGYDLLHVNDLFKKAALDDCRIVGVDLTDYGDLRVSLDRFDCPIEFHNQDVMEYLAGVKPQEFRDDLTPPRCVVVLVDLFMKGNSPIELVYDESFWCTLRDSINPNYIVVNRCTGPETYSVASQVLKLHGCKKNSCLEFYELAKGS